jgi:hypothetical protein
MEYFSPNNKATLCVITPLFYFWHVTWIDVLFAKGEEAKMQVDGQRLQQNLRLKQQPRLESLKLHA